MTRRIINELDDIQRIYWYSSKEIKTAMLDRLCKLYGCHRKAAIRKLNKADHRRKARNGPKVVYEPEELLNPLREIWLATDKMCSKRLREALPLWLPHYSKSLSDGVKGKLLQMSPSTIDRLLHDTRKVEGTNFSGDFVWSLTMVDIYSGWTEIRAA